MNRSVVGDDTGELPALGHSGLQRFNCGSIVRTFRRHGIEFLGRRISTATGNSPQ